MKGLTKKQREIIDYIQDFIQTHNYSPSFREIMSHFGYSCVGTVSKHVQALKRKGVLTWEEKCSRSFSPIVESTPVKIQKSEIELPLIGTLSAGYPIEMFSHSQTIAVPEAMVHDPSKTYVLRAKGDGLHEEMILDGDLLLIEARQHALSGETVIALVNQHDTIVKQYFPEGIYVRLVGHHVHQHPLILREEDIEIQAVMIGLLRFCR